MKNNNIGLHIRLVDYIHRVALKAREMELKSFQTFTIFPCGRYLQLLQDDKQQFRAQRTHFDRLFLHGSYWINCASAYEKADYLLEHEISLAQQLDFNFLVMHPGACHPLLDRTRAIELIARRLNKALKKHPSIHIVLENVAHGKRAIGGNLEELAAIRARCAFPDRVTFCIDTAHAHVYGYDLSMPQAQDEFIEHIVSLLGAENITLIHLNDTKKALGSRLDQHAVPGRGVIGLTALKRFINHPLFAHCAVIVELPPLAQSDEIAILKDIAHKT